jgi:tight adherence protein C
MHQLLLQHSGWVVALLALGIGMSVALVAWIVSRNVAEIPPEDRQYKDAPPLAFRLAWIPIHWISYAIADFLPAKQHDALAVRLRKAGLEYSLSPSQFVAGSIASGLLIAVVIWWGTSTYDFPSEDGAGISLKSYLQFSAVGFLFGYAYPFIWLRDLILRRKSELLKSIPFYLDIITLCVEAGLNMQGAMSQAVAKGPKGVLRDEFQRVLRDIRAGKSRAESLRTMAARLAEPNVTNFITAVIQAEKMGMNLGPVLRAQADQRRSERFLRAEKLAMEAPVKMLFPLIAFIFPCTFIVLFFPIVMKFMNSGL